MCVGWREGRGGREGREERKRKEEREVGENTRIRGGDHKSMYVDTVVCCNRDMRHNCYISM